MTGETIVTVVGNLTADPELRYTQSGIAVASFTVASTPRIFDRQANEFKDGDALFLRCSVWRQIAEQVAGSLTKGTRVIVTGQLKQRSYQDREGQNRVSVELDVDEVGPSLRYATAQVVRAASNQQGRSQASSQAPAQAPAQAPVRAPSPGQTTADAWAPADAYGEDAPW